jgi:hypothetical protein
MVLEKSQHYTQTFRVNFILYKNKLLIGGKIDRLISKIKVLEELARWGADDEVFLQTIDELTRYKIEGLEKDLKDIGTGLNIFEDKYGMDSDEFYHKFESGILGDEMDYLECSSLRDMHKRIKERLEIINGA